MKKLLSAKESGVPSAKALDITAFLGLDRTRLCDGMLLDGKNVTVLSGGALCSLLCERKVDIGAATESLEGVYTYCTEYDAEYETHVTPEWVYENVCPSRVLAYEDWQKECSRLLVKDIGLPAKTSDGYRKVISAFSDGEKVFVFYEARYKVIDQRRQGTFSAVGSALSWVFFSGDDGEDTGCVDVCLLTQVFLDVIDGDSVETSLVDARLDVIKSETASKYEYSRLISTDKENYKYNSTSYAPTVGQSYTIYFDRVYTDIYHSLESGYEVKYYYSVAKKSGVRYRNISDGADSFSAEGEKLLILPDMRLLSRKGGVWTLSDETAADMPKLEGAVQQFDRLYGIYGDTLYVSKKGSCSDFELPESEEKSSAWKTVTTDVGGFTAIAAFDGKVAVFTKKSMLTVRGTELPFTLSYEADCGCFSQSALTALEGELYFISEKGIMCYSGSSMKCISDALPRSTDYSMASLAAADGVLLVALCDIGEIWIYEPSSAQWSRLSLAGDNILLAGDSAIVNGGDGFALYKLFDNVGDFEFVLGFTNKGRRRVKSISVTAAVGEDSELCICNKGGEVLMSIYSPADMPTSRTYYPRGLYIDHGRLYFKGSGDVSLYGVRIEYAKLISSARAMG